MRKQPQQQRARELVKRILQATEAYIANHGLDELTTPKISKISGISVGSIYQYFNNKQEIIESLLEYKSHQLGEEFKQFVLCYNSADLGSLVAASIDFGFKQLQADNGYYLQIVKHWHQLDAQNAMKILENYCYELCLNVLDRLYEGSHRERLHTKAFIIISSVLNTTMNYCIQEKPLFTEEEVKQELTEMVVSYLQK